MTTQIVEIANKIGLHARPATMLVNAAEKYQSDIVMKNGDRTATVKSMISLLALRAKKGDRITIEATGSDEKEAVAALADLIRSKFGED